MSVENRIYLEVWKYELYVQVGVPQKPRYPKTTKSISVLYAQLKTFQNTEKWFMTCIGVQTTKKNWFSLIHT